MLTEWDLYENWRKGGAQNTSQIYSKSQHERREWWNQRDTFQAVEFQTERSSVSTFKKVLFVFVVFFSSIFLPFLCITLRLVKSGLKSTNRHSYNFNYCINTKQHIGDVQNMYDMNETRRRLQYAMARGRGKKKKKKAMRTFTAKKNKN